MFNDLGDDELSFVYSKARALLFASYAEGFGLPIVEALQHGLQVFASDIPIHREIGQKYCSFFSIDDPDSLRGQILSLEHDGVFNGSPPDSFSHISWQESSLSLFTKAVAISNDLYKRQVA